MKRTLMWMIAILAAIAIVPVDLIAQETEAGGTFAAVVSTVLQIAGPTIVAILSVPAFDLIKQVFKLSGKLPAWAQRLAVPFVAYGLTWVASISNVVLPETLEMFTMENTQALVAAAMAFGIKAGDQAKELKGG